MPVRAITFDYWMTLFREQDRALRHELRVESFCRATGANQPEVSRALQEAHETFFTVHVSEQRTILTYPPALIEGALDAVKAAAARGPIGIISDSGMSPGTSLRKLLDTHGLTPYFTTMTFSDELGVAKPQARMFEHTAAALGVAPSELLHIGDLEPTDIVGVQAVGGAGALFAGANDRFAENSKAEYVFHHWDEFLEALPGI
jgi:FMN phosphatase YigB (HAD superfamily)